MKIKKAILWIEALLAIVAVAVILLNRDYIEFRKLRSKGWQLKDCREYIDSHPDGKYNDRIIEEINAQEENYVAMHFSLGTAYADLPREQVLNMANEEKTYLRLFPDGRLASEVHEQVLACTAETDFEKISKQKAPSKFDLESYLEKYPNSPHYSAVKRMYDNMLAERARDEAIRQANAQKQAEADAAARARQQQREAEARAERERKAAEEKAQRERYEQYKDNYLSNGSQPYARYYGYNRRYTEYDDRSAYEIHASSSSDVIAIVKRNNQYGSVVGHVYVRKGNYATIQVPPDAMYQVFFYSGYGWDPEKKHGKVYGGFVSKEVVQHTEPEYLANLKIHQFYLQESSSGNLTLDKDKNLDVAF